MPVIGCLDKMDAFVIKLKFSKIAIRVNKSVMISKLSEMLKVYP